MKSSQLSQNNLLRKTHTFPLHRPLSNNSVPLLMSETFHDFPFSADTCDYLPKVSNKKQTTTEHYLLWCRHFTQDVPQCPISANFVSIYVLFQFHKN